MDTNRYAPGRPPQTTWGASLARTPSLAPPQPGLLGPCSGHPAALGLPAPGATEAGSAGVQPDRGIARPTVYRGYTPRRPPPTLVAGGPLPHPRAPESMPPKTQ